jgi:hypothetical protein
MVKYTTQTSPSLRCNAPFHNSASHESFITSTYVPHQFITGEQTTSFHHRSAASLWNPCAQVVELYSARNQDIHPLSLKAHIISFLFTRNTAWFFTGTSVITFRNSCRDFSQTEQELAACSWYTMDPLLFCLKKPMIVTNQEPSTFPVHRAQSPYLRNNSWKNPPSSEVKLSAICEMCHLVWSRRFSLCHLQESKNPPLEYIQSHQNLVCSLTPCCFYLRHFSVGPHVSEWPASGIFSRSFKERWVWSIDGL